MNYINDWRWWLLVSPTVAVFVFIWMYYVNRSEQNKRIHRRLYQTF